VVDCVISENGNNFTRIRSGVVDHHSTSHLKTDNLPGGGNILFLDGHTQWRDFGLMKIRTAPAFGPNTGSDPSWYSYDFGELRRTTRSSRFFRRLKRRW